MMVVATGGGDGEFDELLCEKYPGEKGCNISPLPMLLAIPRINDYTGGHTMLGLGGIVLPGLLTSFAARLDAAKRLAHTTSLRTRAAAEGVRDVSNVFLQTRRFFFGLFLPYYHRICSRVVVGYAWSLSNESWSASVDASCSFDTCDDIDNREAKR